MRRENGIYRDYQDWLYDLADKMLRGNGQYSMLIDELDSIIFEPEFGNDTNRASDGIDFRLRFAEQNPEYSYRDVYLYLNHPCSVLEMMVALSFRCEEDMMIDFDEGENPGRWFQEMLSSMHLNKMHNEYFDEVYVDDCVTCMMERKYKKNGDGGLFMVKNPDLDMPNAEIWYQMCWYINENS